MTMATLTAKLSSSIATNLDNLVKVSVSLFTVMSMTRNLLVALVCATLLTTACSDVKKVFRPNIWVGDSVPASRNKTVDNVDDWYKVSSLETKVPLYKWQIAELMAQGKPFLVVFGTPQHCTMCVDQIVRVAVMEEKYGERFAFVHVDGYKDNSVWVEWGIKGEPWTYIVDAKGKVRKVFPGQTELALLEQEVLQLIEES